MNDLRTAAINQSLQRTISRARLGKYLVATDENLDAAIGLYERNTRLSEALYTTLQGLEICLRNSIDYEMSAVYGCDWLTNGKPPLQQDAHMAIQDAIAKLGNPKQGDIVAELKFSFWVGLLAQRYDASLWRNALHKGFKAKTGKKRKDVHGRMNALRRFRNRVAHHEPIFGSALQMHAEALEAIEWMCLDTHAWVSACSRFNEVYNS
ncbi:MULTISPECIES: hypothetical protein [unclassified Nitratireductor]|uniref:hypothetical protein n=1 Tax=unclassified Nitratireductor TaxID=2641084 RepID=UPI0025F2A426|nr:hypothetical protein [Nitratireductor sp.]